MKAEEFMKIQRRKVDKDYGICPPPTKAQEGLDILISHFLGDDWYTAMPMDVEQTNTQAICEILEKYPVKEGRRQNPQVVKQADTQAVCGMLKKRKRREKGMMGTWTYASEAMPVQCEDILFLTKKGMIYKGILNLKDTWVIQNADGLIARYMKNSDDVVAWMPLPGKDDEGWIADSTPKDGDRVLVLDRILEEIYIVDVCGNAWVIRNCPDDEITFHAHEGSRWMPLPVVPFTGLL